MIYVNVLAILFYVICWGRYSNQVVVLMTARAIIQCKSMLFMCYSVGLAQVWVWGRSAGLRAHGGTDSATDRSAES